MKNEEKRSQGLLFLLTLNSVWVNTTLIDVINII